MKEGSNKIIVGAPTNFGIIYKIQEELCSLGFQVQEFIIKEKKFKYKNIGQRLYNLYRKSILQDYTYKAKLKALASKDDLRKAIDQMSATSYGLIIRPDLYPVEVLVELRKKVKTLIAYQWDGLDRYPNVRDYIELFDKFYIFDPTDLVQHPNVLPTTNFHMNSDLVDLSKASGKSKVYYVGSYEKSRWKTLLDLTSAIERTNVEKDILLFVGSDTDLYQEVTHRTGITPIQSTISYHKNLQKVKEATVLLDLQADVHKGISFRIFEAIGYDKKVITTNDAVKEYDFYDPQNILVWQNQSSQELMDFLNSPYADLPDYIKQKYSLQNWIKYMLDLDSYIPIDLPTGELVEEL